MESTIQQALQQYRSFQFDAFKRTAGELRTLVQCIDEPLAPSDAVALHQIMAMRSLIQDDLSSMTWAARAIRAVDATFDPGRDIVPEGNQLRSALEAASLWRSRGEPVVLPGDGWVVDGMRGVTSLERDRSALVQHPIKPRAWYLTNTSGPLPESLQVWSDGSSP